MMSTKSYYIVEKAIKILEIVVFEGENGITIKEVSQKIEFHPSTIYRYLNTFLSYGYVSRA